VKLHIVETEAHSHTSTHRSTVHSCRCKKKAAPFLSFIVPQNSLEESKVLPCMILDDNIQLS